MERACSSAAARIERTCTTLEIIEVQPEGKRRMTAQEFINGYQPKSGDHLGQ